MNKLKWSTCESRSLWWKRSSRSPALRDLENQARHAHLLCTQQGAIKGHYAGGLGEKSKLKPRGLERERDLSAVTQPVMGGPLPPVSLTDSVS